MDKHSLYTTNLGSGKDLKSPHTLVLDLLPRSPVVHGCQHDAPVPRGGGESYPAMHGYDELGRYATDVVQTSRCAGPSSSGEPLRSHVGAVATSWTDRRGAAVGVGAGQTLQEGLL
jgi:hypothetical protein